MNITIICDVLGRPNNGTSLAGYNLINCLKERGHNVKVVCGDVDKAGLEGYYILPKRSFWIFDKYLEKNGVEIAKADERLINEACKDADIVHSILPFTAGKCALKYCHEHHIPITSGFHMQAENLTAHLNIENFAPANAATYKYLWKTFYSKVDAIHYPTEFIRDYVKKYNKTNVPAYCISNGVNRELFYPNKVAKPDYLKDKFIVLMSGRLSTEKNQKDLIKALKFSKHKDDIQLYFCGSGPKLKKLEKLSKNLKNKPIFKLHKHEDLHDALWMADLCVHTSFIEIEAISVLEAFACGLVPVISNSPRSATSKFALMEQSSYKFRSLRDLANKIDYWYEHPDELSKAREKYIEFAKQFDYEICMSNMEKMLVDVREKYNKK